VLWPRREAWKNPAFIQPFSRNFPAKIQWAVLMIWMKQALPLNEQGGFVRTVMLRQMLRLARTIR
jgi:hypothetical protein